MKVLRATFPKKCNGCELCVLEAQRQLGKVGIEEAFIRVFKSESGIEFNISFDPQVNNLDIQKIKRICPTQVFEVLDIEDEPQHQF